MSTPSSPAISARRGTSPVGLAPILFFVGAVMCCFGIAMLLPMVVDIFDGHEDYLIFLTCAAGTLFIGASMSIATWNREMRVTLNETLLLIPITWIAVSIVGGVPFMLSEFQLSLTDAVFETVSGLTTTGSTVMIGLDDAPRGLLLWRFMLQWLGGYGVITVAVLALPFLRIGGLQMFSLDLSPNSTKFLPRITEVVSQIGIIYIAFTIACAICYWLAGMTTFDAIGHAMTAVATGGFSSHDASIGYFQSPAIEWISTVFMTIGAMPFGLFVVALYGRFEMLWRDSQVRLFLAIIVAAALGMACWRMLEFGERPLDALRQGFFVITATMSSTGFTSHDYSLWGGFAEALVLMVMLIGGCTGSTAGGIKVFRVYTMVQLLRVQMHRQIYPHGTFRVTFNGENIPDAVRSGVATYIFIYLLTLTGLTLAIAFSGLDFRESLGAAVTSLSNIGPGLGPNSGPCCTFREVPDATKWLMSFGMLAGRLEILVFLIPFSRAFWRN